MREHLLAVDLGLKTGLAVFDEGGRLVRYRSQNYGTVTRLKRAAWGELADVEALVAVAVEGDAALARVWGKAAEKRGARVFAIQAHTWRPELLEERERRTGALAKAAADTLARAIIERSGLPRPKALRHDAAEAICIGLWACRQLGWPSIDGP
ncbi:MAG: hypothetical protein H6719_07570 [Sandaracinaceae bacterium]|nr:hypothetical protein [Sandaracinaceae bacterium]